jgi:sodium ion-translocating decarboxylase beta subunit
MEFLSGLFELTGFGAITWQMLVMWGVVLGMLYLAVFKQFEPLLLVPIAFGALIANLPTKGVIETPPVALHSEMDGVVTKVWVEKGQEVIEQQALFEIRSESGEAHGVISKYKGSVSEIHVSEGQRVYFGQSLIVTAQREVGGLFYYLSQGIHLEIFPPLIFLGVGALTDFGPLIANPRVLLLGAAAQFGVFATFLGAIGLGFSSQAAAAIGIIGGADGPTSIFIANKLAPELLAPIAVAAYSYMALVPLLQPPIMRALTSEKERKIRMRSLRVVSRNEKLVFSLVVTVLCVLLVPDATALIGMLMFGNFLNVCGVTERLSRAAQNEVINVITIFLGASVGISMTGQKFLQFETLKILGLGVVAFGIATAMGVLMAKLMNVFSKDKINPLIGSAGVSAVPMAARVSQVEGQRADPGNFLLMHAMGPNVAGVIGTAVVAGYFIATLGGH